MGVFSESYCQGYNLAITRWRDRLTGASLHSAEKASQRIGINFSRQIVDAVAR